MLKHLNEYKTTKRKHIARTYACFQDSADGIGTPDPDPRNLVSLVFLIEFS